MHASRPSSREAELSRTSPIPTPSATRCASRRSSSKSFPVDRRASSSSGRTGVARPTWRSASSRRSSATRARAASSSRPANCCGWCAKPTTAAWTRPKWTSSPGAAGRRARARRPGRREDLGVGAGDPRTGGQHALQRQARDHHHQQPARSARQHHLNPSCSSSGSARVRGCSKCASGWRCRAPIFAMSSASPRPQRPGRCRSRPAASRRRLPGKPRAWLAPA